MVLVLTEYEVGRVGAVCVESGYCNKRTRKE